MNEDLKNVLDDEEYKALMQETGDGETVIRNHFKNLAKKYGLEQHIDTILGDASEDELNDVRDRLDDQQRQVFDRLNHEFKTQKLFADESRIELKEKVLEDIVITSKRNVDDVLENGVSFLATELSIPEDCVEEAITVLNENGWSFEDVNYVDSPTITEVKELVQNIDNVDDMEFDRFDITDYLRNVRQDAKRKKNRARLNRSKIDEWKQNGKITIDADIFEIVVDKVWEGRSGLRGRLIGDCKENNNDEYPTQVKVSKRSLKSYAQTLCDLNDVSEKHKKSVWKNVLQHKALLSKAAKIGKEDTDNRNAEFDNFDEDVQDVLMTAYKTKGQVRLSELREVLENSDKSVKYIASEYDDLMFVSGVRVVLTERGEEAAEHLLGYKAPSDINVDEEAERHLETHPMKFYLEAFDKIHKGDNYLKIWELVSALSANISDQQIHSWAVGQSLTGSTNVMVKKSDGWTIQTLRSLTEEFDESKDWYTVGVDPYTQETVETPINDVVQHRNNRSLVSIETRSGRTIEGTEDHSFLKHRDGEVVPVSGDELEEGDYVPVVNGHDFSDESTLPDRIGFVLGLYLAEGRRHSKNRVMICNYDDEIVDELERVADLHSIDFNEISGERYTVDISNYRSLFDQAKTGSGEKVVPPLAFQQNTSFHKEMLCGYFAGDGVTGEQPGYTTKSKRLGQGVSLMLSQFDVLTTHRTRDKGDRTYYRFRITKPYSEKRFYDEIGFAREETHEFEDRRRQQYIDKIPVKADELKYASKCYNDVNSEISNSRRDGEMGREKLKSTIEEGNYSDTQYIKRMKKTLNGDIIWDKVEHIEHKEQRRRLVYDIVAGDVPHFLLANGTIVHNSGKGKTHIKRCLMDFLPDKCFTEPSDFSPKALYYKAEEEGPDFMKNKLLFIDEAESNDNDDMLPMLRELTDNSNDFMQYETVRDSNRVVLRIELPVTVWFTSVETVNDEQLKNRFVMTNPDTSKALDLEVNRFQQERLHRGESLGFVPSETPVLKEMIRRIWDDTKNYTVVLPGWTEWKQNFNRRLYPTFYSLVEIITKIHYKQRRREEGNLVATKADFELAADIWDELIETTIAQVDREALRLMKALPPSRNAAAKGATIAEELDGFNTNKVYKKAESLLDTEELGLINMEKDGGEWRYWAGEDRDKISSPGPKMVIDEEIIDEVLGPTPVSVTDELKDYVLNTDIWVAEHLKNGFLNYSDGDPANVDETVTGRDEEDPMFVDETNTSETQGSTMGTSGSDTVKSVDKQILEHLKQHGPTQQTELVDAFDNYSEQELSNALNELKSGGSVYEPKPGLLDVI